MAQQWLVLRPAAAGEPVPVPPQNLPNAILGELKVTTSYATDENHQYLVDVTIGISLPGGDKGDVDRLIVHLFAPDTTVDTQEGFVGGPGTGGSTVGQEVPGLIIGDASNASKIVSIESSAILIEKPWDANRPFVHFTHPAPTENENWKAIVVSASKTAKNKVESSPFKQFLVKPKPPDVSGVEYAPLALDFHLIDRTGATTNLPYYDVVEGGAPKWGFSAAWTNDTRDPRFAVLGGYDLVIEYPGGLRETHASKSSNDTRHDSPMWDIGAPGSFTVWLVSFTSQAGNLRNSIIPGLTPSRTFHVAAPVGPVGKDYADHVIDPLLFQSWYGRNGDGQQTLYLHLKWKKPADRAYAGCIIDMQRDGGAWTPVTGTENDDEQIVETQQFPAPGASMSLKFRWRSVSTSGKVNEYQSGETPERGPVTIYGPPVSTPIVTNFRATLDVGEKDEFGNNLYGFSGSWTRPNTEQFPEYQGVKIFRAGPGPAFANPVALTGIETGTTFKTARWPLTPSSEFFYLYAVTVDRNGRENTLLATTEGEAWWPPHPGFRLDAQGGTIKNEALPDLDVANFASGIEPIKFVNTAVYADGTLAIEKGDTSTVFNQTDDRLYRWQDSISKYKQVGGGPDISANEIQAYHLLAGAVTAGKIAAGAVRTQELAANEILVGPTPGAAGEASTDRPPVFKVNDYVGSMVGFFGTYGTPPTAWRGIYALNLKVGPTYAAPTLEANASGLFLRGYPGTKPVSFEISGQAGDLVRMDTAIFDPTYASMAVQVSTSNGNNKAYLVSRGVVGYEYRNSSADFDGFKDRQLFALARAPGFVAGQLTLYGAVGPPAIKVFLSGCEPLSGADIGVVRADRFDCAGSPGLGTTSLPVYVSYYRAPSGQGTMEFRGGILVNHVVS